jgi:dipeptidase D
MDMVSFGPDIENPHSPDERLRISSVEPFWRLLTTTLAMIAKG